MDKKLSRNNREDLAYMLHSKAWRETSMLIKIFSRAYGRISLIAKGAKRPYSRLRPILLAFQPLLLSWTGKSERKILTKAELDGVRFLSGSSLMPAWYMNELLIRFLPNEDAYPKIFDAYDFALKSLSQEKNNFIILRNFEWVLLQESGYGTEEEKPDFKNPIYRVKYLKSIKKRLQENLGIKKLLTKRVLEEFTQYFESVELTEEKPSFPVISPEETCQ